MKSNIHRKGKPLLPKLRKFYQNETIYIPLFLADPTINRQMLWEIAFENGEFASGKVKKNAINLPKGLPLGKHQLTVVVGKNLIAQAYDLHQNEIEII